jgi:hypothetical protein
MRGDPNAGCRLSRLRRMRGKKIGDLGTERGRNLVQRFQCGIGSGDFHCADETCRTFAASARSSCDHDLSRRSWRRLRASSRFVCFGFRRLIRQNDAFASKKRHTL